MKKLTYLCLLTALLIGGCSTTKVVTPAGTTNNAVQIVPLLENPTRIEADGPSFVATDQDVCIGLLSKFYF
jgi:hypothetical protein